MGQNKTILAAVIGLATAGLAFFLLFQKAEEISAKTTPVNVLVASRYIPAGTTLGPEMVEIRSIPKAYVAPSALGDIREVEGFHALVPLSAGEQVLSNKFGVGSPVLSAALIPGKRAFTLEVDEKSGTGGLLQPGDRVDVLTKTFQNGRELTCVAFQNLEILAVGQDLLKNPNREGEDPLPSRDGGYGTVTLSVSLDEAEILFFLEGKPLHLVLRAPGDEETSLLPTLTESDVLSRLGRASARQKNSSIEIIRPSASQGGTE